MPIDAWEKVLYGDPDKRFISDGIRNGFHIVTDDRDIESVEISNHKVCDNAEIRNKIEHQLISEICDGKYVITSKKPSIVSPLFAIPKDNGTVRIIQNCSAPLGDSVNDRASTEFKVKYQTVQDAVKLLQNGYYMCKIDLKSAYRSVFLNPDD